MEPADRSHPDPEELERFMRGELTRPQASTLVRHLLTGCPRCVAVTRRLWNLGERFLGGLEAALAAESDESLSARAPRGRGFVSPPEKGS